MTSRRGKRLFGSVICSFVAVGASGAGRTSVNGLGGGGPEMGIGAYMGSGIGRELGRYGFDDYSEPKNVHLTLHPKVQWLP